MRLLGALMLVVIALAAGFGGHRYYYCRAMGEVMNDAATCACATPTPDRDTRRSFRASNDCFELRSLDKLVSFTTASAPVVHAAPVMGILPPPIALTPDLSAAAERAHRAIRAGPLLPPVPRAALMVFLT
ncbi:MAG TPA: hypothetical protein VGL13_01470 [Polyangiaceae bacterium]